MIVRTGIARSLLTVLVISLLAGAILAQTTTTQPEYTPSIGQHGKDVVWVPTNQSLVSKMLDMAKVTEKDFLIDLGSGDGRTVIAAAKRGARALGIEYNINMVELSKKSAEKEGVSDKASFIKADLFESDFSQATVITMFLLPEINLKLRPKILELKPGTRIVSNTFTMGEWEADETAGGGEDGDEGYGSYNTALLWIVPAKVEGTWSMSGGELQLTQKYQMIEGSQKNSTGSSAVTKGRLRGDQIRFTIDTTEFTGQVKGSQMQGQALHNGNTSSWTATLQPAR
jgi:precorrin-6B methylase 2